MKTFLSPLLTTAALYGGLRYADAGRVRWAVAAGVAVGAACLVRENHVLMLAPALTWIWSCGARLQFPWKARCGHLCAAVAAAALTISPATAANFAATREFVAVTAGGGEVFYMANGPSASGRYKRPAFIVASPFREHEDFRQEARRRTGATLSRSASSHYWFREGLRYVADHPGTTSRLAGLKAIHLFNDFEVPDSEDYTVYRRIIPLLYVLPTFGWIAGLGFLGVGLCLGRLREMQLPLGLIAAHVVSVLLIYNFGRFRLGMTPVWAIVSAYGAVWTVAKWRGTDGCSLAFALIGTVVAIGGSIVAFIPVADYEADHRNLLRRVNGYADYRDVIRRSSQALQHDPDDSRARLAMALAELQLGRIDEARERFRDAVARSDSAEMQLKWAISLELVGLQDEADRHFQRAVAIRGDLSEARMHLAQSLAWRGRFAEAMEQLDAILKAEPLYLPARRAQVMLAGQVGSISMALEALSHNSFDGRPDERYRLLSSLLKNHRPGFDSRDLRRSAEMLESIAEEFAIAQRTIESCNTLRDAISIAEKCGDKALRTRLQRKLSQTCQPRWNNFVR